MYDRLFSIQQYCYRTVTLSPKFMVTWSVGFTRGCIVILRRGDSYRIVFQLYVYGALLQ